MTDRGVVAHPRETLSMRSIIWPYFLKQGAERQHELIIVHLVSGRQILVPDAHLFLDEISRLDIGDPHPGTMEHLAQGLDDVRNGHIARCHRAIPAWNRH